MVLAPQHHNASLTGVWNVNGMLKVSTLLASPIMRQRQKALLHQCCDPCQPLQNTYILAAAPSWRNAEIHTYIILHCFVAIVSFVELPSGVGSAKLFPQGLQASCRAVSCIIPINISSPTNSNPALLLEWYCFLPCSISLSLSLFFCEFILLHFSCSLVAPLPTLTVPLSECHIFTLCHFGVPWV